MSAIFGIINKKGYPIHMEWLNKMAENLSHRGPDGEGVWMENEIGLGHKLLITTPESQFETQPFEYKKWIITADARIDNRKDLFELLEIKLNKQNCPDSFLILKSYEKWGNKCLEYLIGDFAFAIWDKSEKKIFCATDHTGVRQIYYFESSDYFIFATEIRAIADLEIVPKQLNENKLKDYLLNIWLGGRYESETFFIGIKKIMSAHYLICQNETSRTYNYWKPQTKDIIKFKDKNDYAVALKELIEQAIKDRIRTNYNVGIELSGGLDSSSIACMAARQLLKQNKKLYSASSVMPLNHNGIEEDEREYINTVLNQEKNITPFFVSAINTPIFENLEAEMLKTYSPVNSFYYMDNALHQTLAENANARIVLSGYVGDKTISNQAKSALIHLFREGKYKILFDLIKQRKTVYNKTEWQIFVNDVVMKILPQDLVKAIKKIKGTPTRELFGLDLVSINPDFLSIEEIKNLKSIYTKQYQDSTDFYHGLWDLNELWFDVEMDARISYFNQEAAYPFADKRIIDFLFNVPVEHFLAKGWNRGLIRQAMEGILPSKIQNRKDKSSFSPDFQARLIKEAGFIRSLLSTEKGNKQITEKIDFNKIHKKLDCTRASINWNDFDITTVSILYEGVASILLLKWFQKN